MDLLAESTTGKPNAAKLLKLILKAEESTDLDIGVQFEILPSGMIGSPRGVSDCITYAGRSRDISEIVNDIRFGRDEEGVGDRHFMIKYDADLGEGSGTFVKIEKPLLLKNNSIISYGVSHMGVKISNRSLTLTFLEGPSQDKEYNFQAPKLIKIGRMHDCEVRIDDTSISRYQCLIEYLDPRGWVLYDGNKKNKSTNGTWLYIDDYYQITNGMRFKAGQSLFRVINMQCILGEDLVHI